MKSLLILAFLRALTAAQGIADLPPCSLSCLSTAVTGLGCSLTDFACSCQKASELTPIVTPCVQSACTDPADQAKTNAALAAICASVGSPIETSKPSSLAPEPTPTEPAAAEPTPVEPTTAPSSELPVETQPSATGEPGYSEYSASTSTTSEYAAPTHATDDVPNLPISYSDAVPLPSPIDTTIVSRPSPHPTSVPGVLPPYPTGTAAPSVPTGSGGGVPHPSSSTPPEFPGAASAIKVPMAAAGVFALAAFVL